eukprot:gene19377-biopygen19040
MLVDSCAHRDMSQLHRCGGSPLSLLSLSPLSARSRGTAPVRRTLNTPPVPLNPRRGHNSKSITTIGAPIALSKPVTFHTLGTFGPNRCMCPARVLSDPVPPSAKCPDRVA